MKNRNTKIVATLGPNSSNPLIVRRLAEAGVNVFRLNFSHGTPEDHKKALDAVRKAEADLGRPLATFADLQGPKIRVGKLKGGEIALQYGESYDLIVGKETDLEGTIPIPHPEIMAVLEPGDVVLLNDGLLQFSIVEADGKTAKVRADIPGKLTDKKGFMVRGKTLPIPALTEKDREDLKHATAMGVDMIALSFVQTPEDIREAQALAGPDFPIIAKIERPAAVENIDAIVAATDAVMVARGDLGVEFPPEKVPVIQRAIIRSARAAGRPVIVATQMLESMVDNATPTRAEASDVASATYQGVDGVMLSAETAVGRHPTTAVSIMHRIITEAENAPDYRESVDRFAGTATTHEMIDVIASNVQDIAGCEDADYIALRTGAFSRIARFARTRGSKPIFYGSVSQRRGRQAALLWGVTSLPLDGDANWQKQIMAFVGTDSSCAYAAWAGGDDVAAWETGVVTK